MLVARCSQRRRRPDRRPREAGTWAATRSLAVAALAGAAALAYAQDAQLGRNLAATCANCHGVDGQARGDLIKPLAGMPAERLITALAGFKSGALPATVMHQIARGYSDEQVRAIAAYYAAQPAAR